MEELVCELLLECVIEMMLLELLQVMLYKTNIICLYSIRWCYILWCECTYSKDVFTYTRIYSFHMALYTRCFHM
jgi:hypothetical protein